MKLTVILYGLCFSKNIIKKKLIIESNWLCTNEKYRLHDKDILNNYPHS